MCLATKITYIDDTFDGLGCKSRFGLKCCKLKGMGTVNTPSCAQICNELLWKAFIYKSLMDTTTTHLNRWHSCTFFQLTAELRCVSTYWRVFLLFWQPMINVTPLGQKSISVVLPCCSISMHVFSFKRKGFNSIVLHCTLCSALVDNDRHDQPTVSCLHYSGDQYYVAYASFQVPFICLLCVFGTKCLKWPVFTPCRFNCMLLLLSQRFLFHPCCHFWSRYIWLLDVYQNNCQLNSLMHSFPMRRSTWY